MSTQRRIWNEGRVRERPCIDMFVSVILEAHMRKCCYRALRFSKHFDLYLIRSYSSSVGVHYPQIR